jgi:phage tail sheath protein FI
MANPTYPGVYVEEVASGVRPIAAAGTSTAAFVGLAEMGPDDQALKITSWTEYQRNYGSFIKDAYLSQAVYQYFSNGGRECYIVRIVRAGDHPAATASVQVENSLGDPAIEFSARSKGAWGNSLVLSIDDATGDPVHEFKLSVRRLPQRLDSPPLETLDDLSMDADAPNFVTNVLRARSSLIDAKVIDTSSLSRGRHRGGNKPALPLGDKRSFMTDIDGDGAQQVDLPASVAASTDLGEVASAIQAAVQALTKKKASTHDEAFSHFSCTAVGSGDEAHLLLESGTGAEPASAAANSSVAVQPAASNNATAQLKLGDRDGGTSMNARVVRRPPKMAQIHVGDNASAGSAGSDGSGNLELQAYNDAFGLLDTKTDFSLLAVPGENTTALVDAALGYCANRPLRDVFYIGEMTADADDVAAGQTFRRSLASPNSYGAIYFPWIKAIDPSGVSPEPVLLPPSGYVAGLYARTDSDRGVWKAPAGTAASLVGAVGLATELTDTQHGDLNTIGVNVIRRFANSGIVSFGARTISERGSEWTYVPVRRMAIMIRVSVYSGIQWAVFEPNDELLWSQLRLHVTTFMMGLFRRGAFQGATPSQAFFVKCDSETTTQADIDLGVVNLTLGFAPLKPAEFVIVRISQGAGQGA